VAVGEGMADGRDLAADIGEADVRVRVDPGVYFIRLSAEGGRNLVDVIEVEPIGGLLGRLD